MQLIMELRRRRYARLLRGRGLEIGALGNPMDLPCATEVVYSDVLTPEQVEAMYPGARRPDIISDSEHYPSVADGSFDFIVANHVLEHLTDPLGALTEWFRILRPGGLLLLSVPDKRYTFDHTRPRTTLDHLRAHARSSEPPQKANLPHLHEWAEHVEKLRPGTDAFEEWIAGQIAVGYAVHNHVWVAQDVLEMIRALRDGRGVTFTLRRWTNTNPLGNEFTLLLEKSDRTAHSRLALARAWAVAAHPLHEVVSRVRRWLRRAGRQRPVE